MERNPKKLFKDYDISDTLEFLRECLQRTHYLESELLFVEELETVEKHNAELQSLIVRIPIIVNKLLNLLKNEQQSECL